MRKIKYYGSWRTCGTHGWGYEFTNLRDACKTMRAICMGETPSGNRAEWRVCDTDGEEVKSGWTWECRPAGW